MTYQLKGGEEVRGGLLFGWTGKACNPCNGRGEKYDAHFDRDNTCNACGGTGDEWGLMPHQPKDLPPDTER